MYKLLTEFKLVQWFQESRMSIGTVTENCELPHRILVWLIKLGREVLVPSTR